jgi:hypothetical protein
MALQRERLGWREDWRSYQELIILDDGSAGARV